jgi:hypothetical protein
MPSFIEGRDPSRVLKIPPNCNRRSLIDAVCLLQCFSGSWIFPTLTLVWNFSRIFSIQYTNIINLTGMQGNYIQRRGGLWSGVARSAPFCM